MGRHIVQAAYRALLAAIVYHIWQERNQRVFRHITRPSSTIARNAIDAIRQKILSIELLDSVSSRGLYRLWRIPGLSGIPLDASDCCSSWLKVNSAKSQIIFSRAVQQERQQILDYLGFQEGSLPVKYLGIPLTSSRLTIADCRPLIDKVDARLAGWNNQILSYAGRLQLIKSVLTTLHTYWASAFILPKGVLKTLENKMRQFLWQGSAGSRNVKVAWAWISKPKEEGGLGIRSLTTTNQALMLKQLWRILQTDGTSIWVDWIQRYRLRHSTIWTFNGALGSWGWKKMLKLQPLLQRGVTYKIGDDSSFSLWQDAWHEVPRGPEVTSLPLSSPLSSVIQRNQWCWPASTDTDIIGITSQLPPLHSSAADCISWRSSSGKFTFLDGENNAPEAVILGGDSHGLEGKESPGTREEFDFDEFYELANRVLNGDSEAMVNLNLLKDRWEQKFKTSKNPALKPVTGRPRSHGCSSSSGSTFPSQEKEPQETPIPQMSDLPTQLLGDFPESESQDGRQDEPSFESELQDRRAQEVQTQDCPPRLDSTPLTTVQDGLRCQSDIYIGNVKLQTEFVDTIAGAFLQSSRKTLHFVPPTRQNGEIIMRPTKEWSIMVPKNGGQRLGFFFFRFFNRMAMEDVIEGGPWLFQGQPIVLQPWEQDEGLSTVASGIGTPLYTDGITEDCSRLDFARVCVMLDFNSELPKHLVVISPVLRNGKEDPKRIDVEYEWLSQRCKNCCSLGLVSATCPANMIMNVAPPIKIFVKKQTPQLASRKPEQSLKSTDPRPAASSGSSGINKGKDIVLHNSYSALDTDFPRNDERIMDEDNHTMGPNDSSHVGGS
ncbi:hypothetical protein Sango_3108200 [Sesamum angolense]|uniref:DUF4283 domain-containing protein n=1 Tax=Sesamum angolense TaxID=2727404 RepID=A0AAE1W140_9LAMI|nr:hypothetical protein Sango_3108200 [Sesamum angolense]